MTIYIIHSYFNYKLHIDPMKHIENIENVQYKSLKAFTKPVTTYET